MVIFSILKSWVWVRSWKEVRTQTLKNTNIKGLVEEEQPVDWRMIRKIGRIERDITEAERKESFKRIVQSV